MATPLDQIGEPEEEEEMSFLDHLEELRWHLVRSLIAIGLITICALIFNDFIFHELILPPGEPGFWTFEALCKLGQLVSTDSFCVEDLDFTLQSRKPMGQFTIYFTSSFVIGLIVAFPYVAWEIWRFIKPGLHATEKRAARGVVFYTSLLFALGILFGYFLLTPISVFFFAGFQLDASIENQFDILSYVGMILTIVFGSGLLFQLPMAVLFLSNAGIVTPTLLKKYRRHGIVVILVLGAMLTPPDPFSQILVAIPLVTLYEIGVMVSKRVERRKLKKIEA